MYNLLVVDDEELIRNGIMKVISSCDSLCFRVFCAENGVEALEKIEKENIDAMILDIKMPKLDGIGVLKTLNENSIYLKTVILSGYDEFEYAKVAIEYGASNYILKPIVPNKIIEIAKDIQMELDKEKRQNQELENLKNSLQENLDTLKEKFFNDIITTRIKEKAFKERIEFLNLDIRGNFYQIAVIDIIKYNYFSTEEKCQLINFSIYKYLKNYIKELKNIEYFHISSGQFVILFSFKDKSPTEVTDMLYKLKKIIDCKFNVSTTVGIGNRYKGFDSIKKTYYEAINTVRYDVLLGRENVSSISDIRGNNISLDYMFDFEEFLIRLKLGNMTGITEQLDETFNKIEKNREYNIDIESFNLFCIRLLVYTFMALKELDIDLRSINLNEKEVLFDIYEIKSYEQIKSNILNIIKKVVNKVEYNKNENKKRTIQKVKNIINQNYEKDITIKYIAEELYFNPNYLGQLFKNETNISINEYLNRVRISRAKALLKDTEMMVYEVAEKVGFKDSQYFSTVFKKVIGVTPKEYKEI